MSSLFTITVPLHLIVMPGILASLGAGVIGIAIGNLVFDFILVRRILEKGRKAEAEWEAEWDRKQALKDSARG